MGYLPVVVDAVYMGDYTIKLDFDNGEKSVIDCEPWLKGDIFQPLKDKDYFQKFFVDGWSLSWPNGAGIAPETLYKYGSLV